MTYFNSEGEPLMTAAQARFEAELDMLSANESAMDADYYPGEDYYADHPEECPHFDVSYKHDTKVVCDNCDTHVGWWARGADGWPAMVVEVSDLA